MEQDKSTASKESARIGLLTRGDEHISGDGLAVSINREGRWQRFFARVLDLPKMCCPASESIPQALSTASLSNARQEFLGVPLAVSPFSCCKQGQSISCVAAQIPCTAQLDCAKKEQGQQQPVQVERPPRRRDERGWISRGRAWEN